MSLTYFITTNNNDYVVRNVLLTSVVNSAIFNAHVTFLITSYRIVAYTDKNNLGLEGAALKLSGCTIRQLAFERLSRF